MIKLGVLRLLAVGMTMAATYSANAFYFDISGTATNNRGYFNYNTISETSDLTEFGDSYGYTLSLFGGFGSVDFDVTNGSSAADFSGSGSVSHINDDYSYSGTIFVTSAANSSLHVNNSGTYSAVYDSDDGYFTFSIVGTTAPEPMSVTALGLGAVALLRRRRR